MELLEKSQPQILSDLAGLETLVKDANTWKQKGFPQALLFAGPAGTGKTSASHVIAKYMLGENYDAINFIESNASDDRGIDFVRSELKTAMRSKGLGVSRKVILLDEADGLTSAAQDAMRQLIEKYSKNALIIMTCNEIEKIRPAIRSRCKIYRFKPVSPEDGAKRLYTLLPPMHQRNVVSYSLHKLVELMNGDLRACIMFLDSIDIDDLVDRVEMLEALTVDNSAQLASDGDWEKLRRNLHGLLNTGQSLHQVLYGFYKNIYSHFDDDDSLDNIWDIMAAYGDVMIHKHTWAGDDYSYLDYMVAKMKKEIKKGSE
jgi:replication factor C small subunit|tara:strand:- start:3025 stop:3972 length:948 start_codon:yes stop_codon:yes gene_type:complete